MIVSQAAALKGIRILGQKMAAVRILLSFGAPLMHVCNISINSESGIAPHDTVETSYVAFKATERSVLCNNQFLRCGSWQQS